MPQSLASLAAAIVIAAAGMQPMTVAAQAPDKFSAVTPHDAEHASNAVNWCAIHASRQELVQGLSDCTYALSRNPDDVQALSNRGSIYLLVKDLKAALADFERAIALRPGDAMLHFNRGVTRSDLGQSELAIADYTEAIRLRPDFAAALHNRGYEYELRRDFKHAIADYEAALRVKPDLKQSIKRLEGLRGSL